MTNSLPLRLNFKAFDKAWVLNYAYSLLRESHSLTPWKKEILYFLIDWLTGKDEIKTTTSGSTGIPKTITLKKKYIKNSAKTTIDFFRLQEGNNIFLSLPVKYIAGKLMIIRALEGKMNLYAVEPSLTPVLEDVSIDFAAMTPSQVAALLETEKGKNFLKKIKTLIIGGDKITAALEEKLQSLQTNIWHTYGMTETITHIALRKVNGKNRSKYFTPLPGVSLSLSSDQRLIIDAPHIGVRFLMTNDMAELNDDNTFAIKGRKDNVVISGGIKLFPEEIEKKIEKVIPYPFYFTGITDEKLGNKLVMIIESKQPLNTGNIFNKIKPLLSKYELPKEIIVKQSFEKTVSGKLKRFGL